ncbi:hypothetical protein MMARJ_11810 [Mycobacterium marseillense]|uniref:Uncharacterized protein n=2 Tax=Mycobacterium avium complex (MAC) TaxID=120793 RepID=A0ABM7J9B3_9MYCO|nr:hypothetical protein MMARJ_11810 [Mycobacterium marseillense]GFG96268.1 hypothetical protein MTIM_21470 [Mycobacterium timonense]
MSRTACWHTRYPRSTLRPLGSLPLMEQALARALVAMDPVPLSVVHGIVSDDWLTADQTHFDVRFPQLTFSV